MSRQQCGSVARPGKVRDFQAENTFGRSQPDFIRGVLPADRSEAKLIRIKWSGGLNLWEMAALGIYSPIKIKANPK